MNDELAADVVQAVGGGKARFFEANVLETESIASAVKGALAWVKETGKEVGGVIAAAGVSTPAKVCLSLPLRATWWCVELVRYVSLGLHLELWASAWLVIDRCSNRHVSYILHLSRVVLNILLLQCFVAVLFSRSRFL